MSDRPLAEMDSIKEQSQLSRKLKELDCDIEFWEERDVQDRPSNERWGEVLERMREFLDDGDVAKANEAADSAGLPWVSEESVSLGDRKAEEGDIEEALSSYRSAIDNALRPSVQAELGYLFLRRAMVDPAPLSRFDLEDWPPELSRGLVPGPAIPNQARPEMISLALDAYARVYGYNYYWLGVDHPEGIINPWLQLLALDGLRVALLEMDRSDLAGLVCQVFDAWTDVMGTDFIDDPDALRLERNFAETRGFLRGRELEAAVQEGVEIARRTVVLSDPSAFADALADVVTDRVASRLQPTPSQSREQLEAQLQQDLGHVWSAIPGNIKEMLLEAEFSRSVAPSATARVGVVVQYANSVEALIRNRLGAQHLRLGEIVMRLRDGRLQTRKKCRLKTLMRLIEELLATRNRFAHGDPQEQPEPSVADVIRVHDLLLGQQGVLVNIVDCFGPTSRAEHS